MDGPVAGSVTGNRAALQLRSQKGGGEKTHLLLLEDDESIFIF